MSPSQIRGAAVLGWLLEERCFDVRQLDMAGFQAWLQQHQARWEGDPVFAQRVKVRELRRACPELLAVERELSRATAAEASTASHARLQRLAKRAADAERAVVGLTAALARAAPEKRASLGRKLESFRSRQQTLRAEQEQLVAESQELQNLLRLRHELQVLRTACRVEQAEATLARLQRERGQRSGRAGSSFERQAAELIRHTILPDLLSPPPQKGSDPGPSNPSTEGEKHQKGSDPANANPHTEVTGAQKGSDPANANPHTEVIDAQKGSDPTTTHLPTGGHLRPRSSPGGPMELGPQEGPDEPTGRSALSGSVEVLRGVTLGAARLELDAVVVRQSAETTAPVEVLALVEIKRNLNDLAAGFRHRQENLAWLTGDPEGYSRGAYRTRVFASGHFDRPAVHSEEGRQYLFTRESFRNFRRDAASSLFLDSLYFITRLGPIWGLSGKALHRLSHRISSDLRWDRDDPRAAERLLAWCRRLAHAVETPDVLRLYASSDLRARQILFAGESAPSAPLIVEAS